MPKAVVYTTTSHGGIRFHHLHPKQGLQKVRQIIKHLRIQTTLGNTINITIKANQMHSGVALPILEYTNLLPWMTNWWITNIRESLHQTQSTIHIETPWTIPTIRQQDIHLMTVFQEEGFNKPDLKILNHCRLTLQVTTLAEITNHTGLWLIQEALY